MLSKLMPCELDVIQRMLEKAILWTYILQIKYYTIYVEQGKSSLSLYLVKKLGHNYEYFNP